MRNKAYILGIDVPLRFYKKDEINALLDTIRKINRTGWCINDLITLGIDPDTNYMFIVDLSSRNRFSPSTSQTTTIMLAGSSS